MNVCCLPSWNVLWKEGTKEAGNYRVTGKGAGLSIVYRVEAIDTVAG